VNPDSQDGQSKDGRITYHVFFEVDNTEGTKSATQTRLPRWQRDQWQLMLAGGGYQDGVLYDDTPFALRRARNKRCPKREQGSSGGQ
jgi:hypothetical protein